MKLKVLLDSQGNRRIATESGELIENVAMVTNHDIDTGRVTLLIYGTDIMFERVDTVVDADEQSVRALPAPRPTLPSRTCIELSPEQVQDNFERLQRRPFLCDHDPDDYAPIVRDDDEDGEEWDEES